jgi:hypothetical protein
LDGELGVSYKVLVVPEDPTHNGDILEPLITRMMAECGKPNAQVLVLTNPKVQGYEHARQRLPGILERYRHFDLCLFMVDSDGKDKSPAFRILEADAESSGIKLFALPPYRRSRSGCLQGTHRSLENSGRPCGLTPQ